MNCAQWTHISYSSSRCITPLALSNMATWQWFDNSTIFLPMGYKIDSRKLLNWYEERRKSIQSCISLYTVCSKCMFLYVDTCCATDIVLLSYYSLSSIIEAISFNTSIWWQFWFLLKWSRFERFASANHMFYCGFTQLHWWCIQKVLSICCRGGVNMINNFVNSSQYRLQWE